jgi:hypothetical protein
MAAVNFTYFEIDGKILHYITSGDVTVEDPNADTVRTLSPNNAPLGHKRGMNDISFTLEVMPSTEKEFDFHAAQRNQTTHRIVYEESVDRNTEGNRYLMTEVQFYSVGASASEGENNYSVAGKALDHRPEPAQG